MSDQIPPQQPPYTDVPFSEVPNPGSATPPPAGYPPPVAAPPSAASSGLSPNGAAALSYVTIIPAILFLILEPYNKTPLVRFHAIQCLLLAASWVVVWVVVMIMHAFLHFIPLSWVLFTLLDLAIALGFFIAWLMAIIKASKGEWFKLPVIGDLALNLARGKA